MKKRLKKKLAKNRRMNAQDESSEQIDMDWGYPDQEYQHGSNDDADYEDQLVSEDEQERIYNEVTGDVESWTEISDAWERSNDDGWYYADED